MPILNGDGGGNTLNGGAEADVISGLGGADTLNGGDGNDILYGHSAGASGEIVATVLVSGLATTVAAAHTQADAGFLYVVEKDTGVIWRISEATGARTTFLDVPQNEFLGGGERGVLGLAFHPDYASNGRFFVFLTDVEGDLQVREYHRSAGNPAVADTAYTLIIEVPKQTGFSNHNGGWIGFSPLDGYLYITTGDGGGGGDPSNNAQNLNVLLGKMLRIDINGDDFPTDPARNYAIPPTNPFVGVAGADEIWAYGLRNAWRAAFDPRNGDLYIGDVGQNAREEVDYLAAGVGGANFGWRIMEGTLPFNPGPPGTPQPGDPSLILPVYDYPRTLGASVTGGEIYVGAQTGFVGQFVFADFISGRLFSLSVENGVAVNPVERTAQLAGVALPFVTDFVTGANGVLYAIGLGGSIWRLAPAPGAEDVADLISGGNGADTIVGGAGNDILNGGLGVDTSVYALASTSANWMRNPDGSWTVTAGAAGTDAVSNVEFLDFTDRDVFLDRAVRNLSGNGASDVVFQRNDGVVATWETNGAAITSSAVLSSAGAEWTLRGTGDFGGDGRDDVLWQRSDGLVYIWTMASAGAISSASAVTGLGAEWNYLGVGDLNGDLRDDIAWQRNDGLVFLWQMNGASVEGGGGVLGVGAEWTFEGLGDFNGDGRDDFLWRNTVGQTVIWAMNGAAIQSSGGASLQAGAEWTIQGIGDTNGDGRDDIIWQRTTDGMIAIWAMNGLTVTSSTNVAIADPNVWNIRNIGDYNGDGRDDILWQHDNGLVYAWLLNGASIIGAGGIAGVGAEWTLVG